MDHQQHSFGLHEAALRGDPDSFHRALEMGANINALDDAGRTVLMCAVAGESWQEVDASDASFVTLGRMKVIQTVIEHPNVSLYTLNAPQSAFNGVTPLGMASWLNSPQAVECLLEGSRETVSVNGMDSHAATPLMYAARDGNQEVTRILLSHGARPDFRDKNHRTSVQFTLSHPSTLWQCELALRQHRLRESRHPGRSRLLSASDHLLSLSESFLSSCSQQPSSSSVISTKDSLLQPTHSLVQSISASDASSVQALLFPLSPSLPLPPFVNYPDREGWSPIHRCASSEQLSISVLDSLYCAGADVSLFTTKEHYTPLHCLAHSACLSEEDPDPSLTLYQFAIHLIRDLQAPLSARDKNDETCIHIAAEHGSCIDILMSFLECDTSGSIREFRNSRGLTALEVAKPEFRVAFGDDCDRLRSVSSLSNRTIRALRPTASLTSIVSFSNEKTAARDNDLLVVDDDIALSSHKLIAHLRFTCPNSQHAPDASNVTTLSEALAESQALGQVILQNYRGRADDAMKDLYEVRTVVARIGAMLDKVSDSVDGELAHQGLQPIHVHGGRFRDSQDSQATAVASEDEEYVQVSTTQSSPQASGQCSPMSATGKPADACSIAIQNACLDLIRSATKENQQRSPSFFRSFSGSTPASPLRLATLVDEEEAIIGTQVWDASSIAVAKSHCTEEKTANIFKRAWKHWFKKKDVEPSKVPRPRFKQQLTIDTKACQLPPKVAPESEADEDSHIHSLNTPLRMSHVILDAARKDLHQIEEVLLAAEQFLTAANHSINRTARVIDRAIKKRQTAVETLQTLSLAGNPQNYVHSNSSPYLAAPTPSSCLSSPNSSCVSLAATLTENDDEDVRAIRRLLLRKIEASLGGSIDEINKVAGWVPLVKEAVASVKRRTYL